MLVTYPARILEGSGQVYPPDEEQEMVRSEISQDIRNLLTGGTCPGDPAASCLEISQCNSQMPSEYYWITSSNGTAIHDMTRVCNCDSSNVGGWSRMAYLNMTDPTNQCPPAWSEVISFDQRVRVCYRTNSTLNMGNFAGSGCSSAFFSARIIGYQFGSTNAFAPYIFSTYTRIEDPYVIGVVIVCGSEKQHVWTFAGEFTEESANNIDAICPYTSGMDTGVPPFVGNDYFCETSAVGSMITFNPGDPGSTLGWREPWVSKYLL